MITFASFADEMAKIASELKNRNVIPGGLADYKKPSEFNQAALKKGVKVELEHTSSKDIATEISMDHLTEDPKYYKKLEKIEKKANGDMLQYYMDNPQKLKEKKERDRRKKEKTSSVMQKIKKSMVKYTEGGCSPSK